MAIQSAWILCTTLLSAPNSSAAAGNNERTAATYRSAWQRSFGRRIRTAEIFSQLAMRPRAAGILLPILRQWPQLLGVGARLGGKVSCAVNLDAWRPRLTSPAAAVSTAAERP